MRLIDLFKDAIRFLPPRLYGYLTVTGDNGHVRLTSTNYTNLAPHTGPSYGTTSAFADETAEISGTKDLIKEIEAKKSTIASYKPPFKTVKPAYGPSCAIEIVSKKKFVWDESCTTFPLISGTHAFAINGDRAQRLRDFVAIIPSEIIPLGPQVFVDADGATNALENLAFEIVSANGHGHVNTSGLKLLPYRPMTLHTSKTNSTKGWSRAMCEKQLDSSDSKKAWIPIKITGGNERYLDSKDYKHILRAIDDTFKILDAEQTIIRLDLLEGDRVRLYWETDIATYSQVMKLAMT